MKSSRSGVRAIVLALVVASCTGNGIDRPPVSDTGEQTTAPDLATTPPPSDAPASTDSLSYQFVPTGTLAQGCAWCPAALLDDGRVLVLGGWPSTEGEGAQAELYDPATGTFSKTGPPAGDFNQGSAVPLDDGRVLVIFGLSERAELYDPATGEFQPTDIGFPQGQDGVAVKLADGRVLVLGNRGPSGIFDPSDDTFTTVASPDLDGEFDAVLLESGDVLIVDGQQAMTYDPVQGTIAKTGDLITPRGWHTLTRLLDGRVLIAGGQELVEPYDLVSQAEIYDPETTTFTVTGYMNVPRWWHAATLLTDGQVMFVGGRGDSPAGFDSAEIFDPSTGEFLLVTSTMTRPRVAGTAITLNDGRVLVFGHYSGNGGFGSDAGSSTAEVFTQGRQVDEGEDAVAENPTEVDVEATFDLAPVLSAESGSTELRAKLFIPPGSLEGVTEMHALATLDMEGAPSTGTITVEVGAPFSQVLSWDLSDGSGGSGGGGEVDLEAACDAGCDMTIPVTVSWTGDVATGVVGLRLQFGYAGRSPNASEGIELTIVEP